MKRSILAGFTALLMLFSGCAKIDIFPDIFASSHSSTSSSSSAPAPIPPPESSSATSAPAVSDALTHLLPEAGLPEKLASSALVKTALTQPCIIAYDNQPVTDRTSADAFRAAVEAKKPAQLFVYNFSSYDGNILVRQLTTDGGTGTASHASLATPTAALSFEAPTKVSSFAFNDYGRMIVTGEGSTEPTNIIMVSGYQLYPDFTQRQELLQKYISPIANEAPINTTWDAPTQLTNWVWTYESLFYHTNSFSTPWDVYGNNWPVPAMVQLISTYFDIDPQMLHGALASDMRGKYDADNDTLYYEGGRGGYSPTHMVTGRRLTGDMMEIDYYQENFDGTPVPGFSHCTLTLRILPDDTFRYLSNRVA